MMLNQTAAGLALNLHRDKAEANDRIGWTAIVNPEDREFNNVQFLERIHGRIVEGGFCH
jgi:hypothetical protein